MVLLDKFHCLFQQKNNIAFTTNPVLYQYRLDQILTQLSIKTLCGGRSQQVGPQLPCVVVENKNATKMQYNR